MSAISTPDLCDQHEDSVSVVEVQMQSFGGKDSFGGPITTVKCHEDNSLIKELASQPGNGRVMVVDGGGSMRRALLGDQIAENAVRNGWQGFVIYGCVRDVEHLQQLELGVKALGAVPLRTQKRGIGDQDIEIRFGGVTFVPGYHLYADRNGIILSAKPL